MPSTSEEREVLIQRPTTRGRCRWRCNYIIEPLLFLYMAADFPTGPLADQVLFSKVAQELGYMDNSTTNQSSNPCLATNKSDLEKKVAKEVADWSFYLSTGESVIQLLSVIIWGTLIDRYGRRLSFILPPIGDILYCTAYILVIKLNLPIRYLLFSLLRPCFGYAGLFVLGSYTYVADTVHESQRGFRMTFLQIMYYVSGAGSALALARFIPKRDLSKFSWAFLAVISGKILALLYAAFLVPETLTDTSPDSTSIQRESSNRKRFSFESLRRGLSFLIVDNGEGRRWRFWTLIGVYVVSFSFDAANLFSIFVLIRPFCWENAMLLDYHAYNLVIHCLGALLCTKLLACWLDESWQAVIGQLSGVLMFFFWCLVSSTAMIFLLPVCGFFTFVVVPLSKSMLSKLVDKQEQGATFAIYICVQKVIHIVNMMVIFKTYKATIDLFNGRFTFFITGWLRAVGLLLLMVYAVLSQRKRREQSLEKE